MAPTYKTWGDVPVPGARPIELTFARIDGEESVLIGHDDGGDDLHLWQIVKVPLGGLDDLISALQDFRDYHGVSKTRLPDRYQQKLGDDRLTGRKL